MYRRISQTECCQNIIQDGRFLFVKKRNDQRIGGEIKPKQATEDDKSGGFKERRRLNLDVDVGGPSIKVMMMTFSAGTGLSWGLPVVQEVKPSLQDAAACVKL